MRNGFSFRASGVRRLSLAVFLLATGVLGAVVRGQQGAAPPPPRLIKVAEDLYVIQNANHTVAEIGPNGGNVAVIVTREGVILVDSKFERMHDDIMAKVKSVTDRPVRYLVLTHNHGDHAGGAARFQSMGVTVVSLPGRRAVIAGDLVTTPDSIPAIVNYADGGNWTELGESLEAIGRMDFDVLIGGHGPNLTKADFTAFKAKVHGIRERFRALIREKKTQDEIAQTLMKEFNWGSGPAAGNLAGMMQELR